VLHSQQSRNRRMRRSLLCGGNMENHVSEMDVKDLFIVSLLVRISHTIETNCTKLGGTLKTVNHVICR
jgi:hypothetical protein